MKYTKGEWKIVHSQSKPAFNIIGTVLGGKYKIARCPYVEHEDFELQQREIDEAEANAKLIAAAPDLLEACKKVVEGYETDGMENMRTRDEVFYKYCKAAIKKATE